MRKSATIGKGLIWQSPIAQDTCSHCIDIDCWDCNTDRRGQAHQLRRPGDARCQGSPTRQAWREVKLGKAQKSSLGVPTIADQFGAAWEVAIGRVGRRRARPRRGPWSGYKWFRWRSSRCAASHLRCTRLACFLQQMERGGQHACTLDSPCECGSARRHSMQSWGNTGTGGFGTFEAAPFGERPLFLLWPAAQKKRGRDGGPGWWQRIPPALNFWKRKYDRSREKQSHAQVRARRKCPVLGHVVLSSCDE